MISLQEINSIQIEKTISVLELIKSSGIGGIVIIGILFVLLIIVIFIYLERLFAIKAASIIDKDFMPQIKLPIIQKSRSSKHCPCRKTQQINSKCKYTASIKI